MDRSMPFVQSGPYPFKNGGLPAMVSGRGGGFKMPAVRGGSAKPTPQEKAVVESATGVNSEDLIVESLPVDMPQLDMSELDMVVIEEPKKISPMTYAIGAAALVLGGLYLLRN
jgi:hypothetical protein